MLYHIIYKHIKFLYEGLKDMKDVNFAERTFIG